MHAITPTIGRIARVLAPLLAGLCLSSPLSAQFEGSFSIEKHALDEENFLDWRAYQHPYPWRYALYRAPNYLQATVGSLSKQEFYLYQEVRLGKDIGRYGHVGYYQREDSFYRPEPIYQEVEFRFGANDLYLSILGFPKHDKRTLNQGFAVAWGRRTDWNYIRVSHVDIHRLYNSENDGASRYMLEPEFTRLEARTFWRDAVLVQLEARDDGDAVLSTPDADDPGRGRIEAFSGRSAELRLDVHWSEHVVTGLHWRGQREQRSRKPDSPASSITRSAQALHYSWADAYVVLTFAGGSVLELGAYDGTFRNAIAAELPAENFDHALLTEGAYVIWTWPRSDWFQWVFSFQAGPARLRLMDFADLPSATDERSNQLKAGAGLVLQEAERYRFLFNTTWDLDVFDQRQWDGGNVQLVFLF